MSIFLLVVICSAIISICHAAASFNTSSWQRVDDMFTFPEKNIPYVASRPNVGLTFSGGGDRAFVETTGVLGAFHELGYMSNVKYIAGSSGGSWGISVYSYYQKDYVTDSVMLGPIVFPANISYDQLAAIDENCVRAYTNSSYFDSGILYSDWLDAVQAIYLTPSNIPRGVPFSYDNITVADIKRRNPSLENIDFLVLRGNFNESRPGIDKRPFPIIQATLDGPLAQMPWRPENRNYSMIEWTALTAGIAVSSEFVYNTFNSTEYTTKMMGGFIEPFAFGTQHSPSAGLPVGVRSGFLEVPAGNGALKCDVCMATGTSSWAPGQDIAASFDEVIQRSAGTINYWSPSASNPSAEAAVYAAGDGAGISNTDLISFLQRNVSSIIAIINTGTPLQNSTHWDPLTMNLTSRVIDFTVPAWFGKIADNMTAINEAAYDLVNSQVFIGEEWLPMVTALQAAQARGNGVVINMTHTTWPNKKFGIVGGRKVNVVWVYMGSRVFNWEAQLSEDMRSKVVPEEDPLNQASLIQKDPFRHFPCYATTLASTNIRQANLLANLAGWIVYQNQDIFKNALGISTPAATPSPTVMPSAAPTSPGDSTSGSGGGNSSFENSDLGIGVISAVCAVGLVLVGIVAYVYVFVWKAGSTSLLAGHTNSSSPSGGTETELQTRNTLSSPDPEAAAAAVALEP